jgi:hypothetical protein
MSDDCARRSPLLVHRMAGELMNLRRMDGLAKFFAVLLIIVIISALILSAFPA